MSKERFIYTLSVSFPRCGFGVTHQTINDYFSRHPEVSNYIVCLPANEEGRPGAPSNFCFSDVVPFKSQGVVLQKSHDFVTKPIDIKKDSNTQYLQLYRPPLSSIASNYFKHKKDVARKQHTKQHRDILTFKYYRKLVINKWNRFIHNKSNARKNNPLPFKKFAMIEVDKWNRFMTKWFFDDSITILRIEYDDLVKNPLQNISKIIKFMAPDHQINVSLLKEILVERKIEHKNRVEDYEFYNKKDFEKYEALTIWDKIRIHSSGK